jgi:hypothetical protein
MTRQAASAVNTKLSEYHVAVGLAALDEWASARAEWMRVAQGMVPEIIVRPAEIMSKKSLIALGCCLASAPTQDRDQTPEFLKIETSEPKTW